MSYFFSNLHPGKIRPDTADEFREEFLYVPPIPPTNLRNCLLITIEYCVMVSVCSLPFQFFFSSICLQLEHESQSQLLVAIPPAVQFPHKAKRSY